MIELHINNKIFSGWHTASINRGLNTFSSSFKLSVSEQGNVYIPFNQSCKISLNKEDVIDGFIDEISPSYSGNSHTISFSGRSKTCDLVDCSADIPSGQIKNTRLDYIIATLLDSYSDLYVDYKVDKDILVEDFQIQQGETVSAAIEKLCANYNLVFYDNNEGNLIIEEMKQREPSAVLIHRLKGNKNNILSGNCTYSSKDMYSHYIVKSQTKVEDKASAKDHFQTVTISDDNVGRYRPLIIIADSACKNDTLLSRAKSEKAAKINSGLTLEYTVQGWLTPNNELWSPGMFVKIEDDYIKISGHLIISEVNFEFSESGTITNLKLTPPEVYLKDKDGMWEGWNEIAKGAY